MARVTASKEIQQPTMDKIYRKKQVLAITGISNTTLYEMIARKTFPAPISLGSPRSVGWLDSELRQWQDERIKERDDAKTVAA